jgi:hypothetical protein
MPTGIENASVVDLVTVDPKTTQHALIMIAVEPWTDDKVLALQAKTQAYLSFVESGELVKRYPGATGKPLRFQLDTAYELSGMAAQFVAVAERDWLAPVGIEFRVNEVKQ